MLRKIYLLTGLLLLFSVSAGAQDRVELFGGYSFEHFGTSPSRNLNGWEVSAQYKVLSWIGAVADIDGHYASPSGLDTRQVNFMVGPQISFPSHISPFAHVLVGIDHTRFGSSADTSVATAVGGGIDWHLVPFISWRVFQIDELYTHVFGGKQNSARVSTGVVIHF
jgi:hypothetical protein